MPTGTKRDALRAVELVAILLAFARNYGSASLEARILELAEFADVKVDEQLIKEKQK